MHKFILIPRHGSTGSPIVAQMLTLHWTAGDYDDTYDHYHFCVKGSGEVVQTRSVHRKGSHTWLRNTDNIGLSFCAMAKGCPITDLQIERMARLVAELCHRFQIGLDDKYLGPEYRYDRKANALNPTGKMRLFDCVTDHQTYSMADGNYGKVDVGELLDVVKKKARWYLSKLQTPADYQLTKGIH